jgi:hypothetical protein
MLKRLALLAAVLALGALTAAAEPPCTGAGDLSALFAPAPEPAWLFEPAAQPAVAAASTEGATIALASTGSRPGGGQITAFCQANCASGTVSCSGSVCSAYNRNCPYEQGHVVCDGAYTWCPTSCPECTNGQILWEPTGACCDGLTEKDKYKCISETWVYQGTFCKPPICGPF